MRHNLMRTLAACAALLAAGAVGGCNSSSDSLIGGGGFGAVDINASANLALVTDPAGAAIGALVPGIPAALAAFTGVDVSGLSAVGISKPGARMAVGDPVPSTGCDRLTVDEVDPLSPPTTIPDPMTLHSDAVDATGAETCVHTVLGYDDATMSYVNFDNPVSGSYIYTFTGFGGVPLTGGSAAITGTSPFGIGVEAVNRFERWIQDPQPSTDTLNGKIQLQFNEGGAGMGHLTSVPEFSHTEVSVDDGTFIEKVSLVDITFMHVVGIDTFEEKLSVSMSDVNGSLRYATNRTGYVDVVLEAMAMDPFCPFFTDGVMHLLDAAAREVLVEFSPLPPLGCGFADVTLSDGTKETVELYLL